MRYLKSTASRFVAIGIALYVINGFLFPPPKPVIGPPNAQRVAQQLEALERLQQTPLLEEQRVIVKQRELRDQLLFVEAISRGIINDDLVVQRRLIRNMRFMNPERDDTDAALLAEAWELRLHLADEVVRRRTVQVMETLIVASRGEPLLAEAALRATYRDRLSEFEEPVRFSFTHAFLREDASVARLEALTALVDAGASPSTVKSASDVFLAGYAFNKVSLVEISRQFGDEFVDNFKQEVGETQVWHGPIASLFGEHWVWLESKTAGRTKPFEEVESELKRDARRNLDDATIQQWVDDRLTHYEVIL